MKNMIFVSGFARGGTSWLRDCIGSHPGIAVLPGERVVFQDYARPDKIRTYFNNALAEESLSDAAWVVNKAPANAPYFGKAARAFPESKFIFIIRDPRDVFISHKRGDKAWMGGANSTVDGCMKKTASYFAGWEDAADLPNVHLVRYEDLHQNFHQTAASIFDFIGIAYDQGLLNKIYSSNDFRSQTARKNKEDRSAAKRKGVIGDWAIHLEPRERDWYLRSGYWTDFMKRFGYGWETLNYPDILHAMHKAGCHFVSEEELLARKIRTDRVNVILFHDIDDLNSEFSFESIRDTARAEASVDAPAIYNFLPLDDVRYRKTTPGHVAALISDIKQINPKAAIGLHFNASERFFPGSLPDIGDEIPDLAEAMGYLHTQIDEYAGLGVHFKTATAHGYGRGRKRPNNRDTPEFSKELLTRGVQMFDTIIRPDLAESASQICALTDVGGVIKLRQMFDNGSIVDPATYRRMPNGAVVRFLTHPGNYEAKKPAVLSMRHFTTSKEVEEKAA